MGIRSNEPFLWHHDLTHSYGKTDRTVSRDRARSGTIPSVAPGARHRPMKRRNDNATWRSLDRAHAPRLWEQMAEKAILLISLTTILFVLLIFLFIGRESLPIILQTSKAPFPGESIPVSDLDSTPPETIQRYLELSEEEYRSMESETIALLLEVKLQALAATPVEGDVTIQSTRWRYLLRPFQWIGYDAPEYI